MFSNKSISFAKKTQNSTNDTSHVAGNASAVFSESLLSASASPLNNFFSKSLHLLGGNDPDAAGLYPAPSKTPVIICATVEMVIERAVIIDIIVIPCSRNKVQNFSFKNPYLSRTFSMVCLILVICV